MAVELYLVPRLARGAGVVVLDDPVLDECAVRDVVVLEDELLPGRAVGRHRRAAADAVVEEVRVDLQRVGVRDRRAGVADRPAQARHVRQRVERTDGRGDETARRARRDVVVVADDHRAHTAFRRHRVVRRLDAGDLAPFAGRERGLEAALLRQRDLRHRNAPVGALLRLIRLLRRRRLRRHQEEQGQRDEDAERLESAALQGKGHGHRLSSMNNLRTGPRVVHR